MAFLTDYIYDSDNGISYALRMSDATAAAHPGGAPTRGANDTGVSCNVSGNRNIAGMHARGLRLKRFTGTGVNRKSFSTFMPVATAAAWAGVATGSTVTIGTLAYTVSSKVPERPR